MPMPSLAQRLGWAFYLACSWTWCIGMFLPVILHKDFSNGAWALFWLCNVIGATAFGFVMADAGRSQAFVQAHARACAVFSLVTIAFQAFFIGWVLSHFPGWVGGLPLLALLALWFGGSRDTRGLQASATAVWLLSVAALAVYLLASPQADLAATLQAELLHAHAESLYALPVLLFGFLLSPYLDLSFHQVPQASRPQACRWSFAIGFPLLFGLLLLFALAYRDEVAALLLGNAPHALAPYLQGVLAFLILQAGFTLIVHSRRLQVQAVVARPLLLACAALPALVAPLLGSWQLPLGLGVGETVYRSFMAFYGLIAPAYVWLVAFNPKPLSPLLASAAVLLALAVASVPMLLPSPDHLWLYPMAVSTVLLARFIGR